MLDSSATPNPLPNDIQCSNGHPLAQGDLLCSICGSSIAEKCGGPVTPAPVVAIDSWTIIDQIEDQTVPWTRYRVRGQNDERGGVLTLYAENYEPDPAVQNAVRKLSQENFSQLLAVGRSGNSFYEVIEDLGNGTLRDVPVNNDLESVSLLVQQISSALAELSTSGLRHRDLRPTSIYVRSTEPLDLVVSDFGSARLSEFDLEAVAPLRVGYYSAPEAIGGAVSVGSDWWSLGVILLERLSCGQCFAGVNEQAFLIQTVTRGIDVPADLDSRIKLLLKGLLTRDPQQRWAWAEVRSWLAGESPVVSHDDVKPVSSGPSFNFQNREIRRPEEWALIAAEKANWEAARDVLLRGAVMTWLENFENERQRVFDLRRIIADELLSDDYRLSLGLMALNSELPLIIRGEIVNPSWLLRNPTEGYEIITGHIGAHLERMSRQPILVELRKRVDRIRERIRLLDIPVDENRFRVAVLATSRANLEAERVNVRKLNPDSEHSALSSLLERPALADEDLIVVLSAQQSLFTPLSTVVARAQEAGNQLGLQIAESAAVELAKRSRRDLYRMIDERTESFAQCGIEKADLWVDRYRTERRISLASALAILSIPANRWQKPPQQEYVSNLLGYFEKKVSLSVQRGPLVRFTIGKTTARVDVKELETRSLSASMIVRQIIERNEAPISLDPLAFSDQNTLAQRLRHLINHSVMFKKDTGIDGRHLGFPFLLFQDQAGETKPRISPLFLWPVTITQTVGSSAARVAYDARDEIRINPALEALIGPELFAKVKAARDDLVQRTNLRIEDIIVSLSHFEIPKDFSITNIPHKDTVAPKGSARVVNSAALFNLEFAGQEVTSDLRALRNIPPHGTALEKMLRMNERAIPAEDTTLRDHESVLTGDSDPSQELAVQRARDVAGLLIEGPPGTGKSQTIVNIVADSIARNESILIVCQKQSAIQVVQKRLEAEQLGNRLFTITDANKDRQRVMRDLREQVESLRASQVEILKQLRRRKNEVDRRIKDISAALDRHQQALYEIDVQASASYREIIGELLRIEDSEHYLTLTAIRYVFAHLNRSEARATANEVATLAPLWLKSNFEENPLKVMKPFIVDSDLARQISMEIGSLEEAENARKQKYSVRSSDFDTDNPEAVTEWLSHNAEKFRNTEDIVRKAFIAWHKLFVRNSKGNSVGNDLLSKCENIKNIVFRLHHESHDDELFPALYLVEDKTLKLISKRSSVATSRPTFWQLLFLSKWRAKRYVRKFLIEQQFEQSDEVMYRLRDASKLEILIRPLRNEENGIRKRLKLTPKPEASVWELREETDRLSSMLKQVSVLADAAEGCPIKRPEPSIWIESKESFENLESNLTAAVERANAREAVFKALDRVTPYFSDEWSTSKEKRIQSGLDILSDIQTIRSWLPTLAAFQLFRSRAATFRTDTLQIFAELRKNADRISKLSESAIIQTVNDSLIREALLSWKARIETANGVLHRNSAEIVSQIEDLTKQEDEKRKISRELLAKDIQTPATPAQWAQAVRISGQNPTRIRQLFEQGRELGLMKIRPVWLMNPDIASRILPRIAGMFDLLIFDEASQMLVEYSLPSLFRAKRVVISGDEHQMPPSRFFTTSVDGDSDGEGFPSDDEDSMSDAERAAAEEKWNRREIKDCPDLLHLGREVLPSSMLQVHYRSKYRELIGFSNAAYYQNKLSVPARQPDAEVLRAKTIELLQVNGEYIDQTNKAESETVVQKILELWRAKKSPPTIGVVTFNRKQADLIEDDLERLAELDPQFRTTYQRERERNDQGEDVSFFVKNVENVQGDERDIIIFSTTFGINERGKFIRNFGVLGQTGGERRLNVAVTRAKQKNIIITSMPIDRISDWTPKKGKPKKPREFLHAYLEYARRIHEGKLSDSRSLISTVGSREECSGDNADLLTNSVADFVRKLGFDPIYLKDGDAFSLDLAIQTPNSDFYAFGIECDAPRHDLLVGARAREIWRKNVLSRGIPHIYRVNSLDWYRDRKDQQEKLAKKISEVMGEISERA